MVPSQPLALSQSQSTGQSQILRSIHPLSLQLSSQNSSQSSSRRPAESDSPAMPKSISSSPKVTDPRLASPSSRSVRKSPTKQTPQSLPRTSQTATPTTPTNRSSCHRKFAQELRRHRPCHHRAKLQIPCPRTAGLESKTEAEDVFSGRRFRQSSAVQQPIQAHAPDADVTYFYPPPPTRRPRRLVSAMHRQRRRNVFRTQRRRTASKPLVQRHHCSPMTQRRPSQSNHEQLR